jgi:hypothetical protein
MRTWRRKSVYDPEFRMGRTHSFPAGTANIPTGDAFPERTHPITFSCHIKITSATPAGVVFEFGSATTGAAMWIAAADRKLMAAVGDDVTLTGPVCIDGQELRVVLACIPANGKARLWVNGRLVASGQAAGLVLPNGWSDSGIGSVG